MRTAAWLGLGSRPIPNPNPNPNSNPDPDLHSDSGPDPTRCARPPARVRAAKAQWEARHDSSLIDRLDSELSGHFQVRVRLGLGLGFPG